MIASYNSDGTHVGLLYQGEYYRIVDDDFSRYLSTICAGGNRAAAPGNKVRLSLDDVIMLSQKGEGLSWEDFAPYSYVETGSGLYIRLYEINPLFSLWIGGNHPSNEPMQIMYILLRTNMEPEDAIDIRTEDVAAFISRHIDDLEEASFFRVYKFSDLEDSTKNAKVALHEDGTFTFSPLSSYIGIGTYRIGGERLMLTTGDGKYVYVFDMVDGTLVFDADASSEQVRFSGITDGSVFR